MKRINVSKPGNAAKPGAGEVQYADIIDEKKAKRNRSSNFSKEDEKILLRCVLKHKNIIESKKTDSFSIADKQKAWVAVEEEYNATFSNEPRPLKALRDKYTNIKSNIRKETASGRLEHKATGGGQPKKEWQPKTDEHSELELVIAKSIHGDPEDCFDDECVEEFLVEDIQEASYVSTINTSTHSKDKNEEPMIDDKENRLDESDNVDWSQYTPSMLKKPAKKVLQVQKQNAGNAILDLKKTILQQEVELNELKMVQMRQAIDQGKQLHELNEIKKFQLNQGIHQEKEIHKLRVQILKAKVNERPRSPFLIEDD